MAVIAAPLGRVGVYLAAALAAAMFVVALVLIRWE